MTDKFQTSAMQQSYSDKFENEWKPLFTSIEQRVFWLYYFE